MGKAVSSVAHDMKTPLMAIGGFTSLVQRKLKRDDPSYEKLGIVIRETRRLENMVREMLDFSRPLQLRPDETDINKTIRRSVDVVSQAPESGKIALEVQTSDGIPAAAFDAMRMEQVLINLLMNAIQASPEGGHISVRTSREGDYARIDVEDSGAGLSPGDEESLFSPFFTTKKDGTGLGLPIVKKIVEAHGGEVSFRPNPKKGMTFTVKIPIRIQL
jgi:two-component system sensor histidine kinase HydH